MQKEGDSNLALLRNLVELMEPEVPLQYPDATTVANNAENLEKLVFWHRWLPEAKTSFEQGIILMLQILIREGAEGKVKK